MKRFYLSMSILSILCCLYWIYSVLIAINKNRIDRLFIYLVILGLAFYSTKENFKIYKQL